MPYQTTRMVAKARNRFCPIPSKIPRFCWTSAFTARRTKSNRFMPSPLGSVRSGPSESLRQPLARLALGGVAVERSLVLRAFLSPLYGRVEVGHAHILFLF